MVRKLLKFGFKLCCTFSSSSREAGSFPIRLAFHRWMKGSEVPISKYEVAFESDSESMGDACFFFLLSFYFLKFVCITFLFRQWATLLFQEHTREVIG